VCLISTDVLALSHCFSLKSVCMLTLLNFFMYSALEDKNDHFGLFLLFKNISSSHFFRFLNKMTIMRAASQS